MALARVLLLGCVALAAAQAEAEPEEWIESYDKASNRKFYYSAKTRESAWEAPEGAKIRYQDGSSSSAKAKPESSNSVMVLLGLLLPIVLPLAGLAYCYHLASKEGLADMLKTMKAKRDRSAKRRSTKAGGKSYQHGRNKLSQDGKGGRSANS
uniref:WW domain-containing protein n=1 Tax=Prymnesium polylepis TaxID=72548 RepID=A0A6V4CQ68_9EUKA|mmetsp:Transcript_6038/g.15808  ORF Transcript_6038/g.15808 Transcript_6038/m.15808 type:complete len:153 (-) Transcript_6038:176-634(-)